MTSSFELSAEFRDGQGKGASRRLRREGLVPAILYGGGEAPRPLALNHAQLLHQLQNEAFSSHILTIKVGDVEQQAILKDLQRHPFKRAIVHADFQRVIAGEEIRVNVPLHFVGEDQSPGKRAGGIITHMITDTAIACLPRNLPEFLEIDVSGMEIDDILHLSDVVLPEGVELSDLTDELDPAVVSVSRPQKDEDEEEAAEAAAAAAAVAAAEPEDKPGEDGEKTED